MILLVAGKSDFAAQNFGGEFLRANENAERGGERVYSRLCLLGKRFVHPDWLKSRIHALTKHIHDIDSGSGIVAFQVAALARGIAA